jgi:hypothetical protein
VTMHSSVSTRGLWSIDRGGFVQLLRGCATCYNCYLIPYNKDRPAVHSTIRRCYKEANRWHHRYAITVVADVRLVVIITIRKCTTKTILLLSPNKNPGGGGGSMEKLNLV